MQNSAKSAADREWHGADGEGAAQLIDLHSWNAGAQPVLPCLWVKVHIPCR